MTRTLRHPLLWASGASPADIVEAGAANRYGTAGALVLLMSTWSGAAMALAVHSSLNQPTPVAAAIGVFFGVFVCLLDRMTAGLPILQDGWRYRLLHVLLVRSLLALATSAVVTHAALIAVFAGEIDARLAGERQAALAAFDQQQQHSHDADLVQAERSKIEAANRAVDTAHTQAIAADQAWACERAGCPGSSGQPGNGDIAQALGRQDQAAWATYQQALVSAAATTAQSNQAIAVANARQATARLTYSAVLAHADGLGARSTELFRMLAEDPALLMWAAFFLMLDLAVVLQKATLPPSSLDHLYRRRNHLASLANDEGAAERAADAEIAILRADLRSHRLANEVAVLKAESDRDRKAALADLREKQTQGTHQPRIDAVIPVAPRPRRQARPRHPAIPDVFQGRQVSTARRRT